MNGICCNAQRTTDVTTKTRAIIDFLSSFKCSLTLFIIHMLTIEEHINKINIYNPNNANDAEIPTVLNSNIKQAKGIKIKAKKPIPIAGITFVDAKEDAFFTKFGAIHKASK